MQEDNRGGTRGSSGQQSVHGDRGPTDLDSEAEMLHPGSEKCRLQLLQTWGRGSDQDRREHGCGEQDGREKTWYKQECQTGPEADSG